MPASGSSRHGAASTTLTLDEVVGEAVPDVAPAAAPLTDAPLRRWIVLAVVGDVAMALAVSTAARLLRFGSEATNVEGTSSLAISYIAIGLAVTVLWPVLLAFGGAYDYRAALFGIEEVRCVIQSGIALLALFSIVYFAVQLDFSRGYALILLPGLVVLTSLWRLALRRRTSRQQRAGLGRHRAVIVGPLEDVHRVYMEVQSKPWSPINVVGYVLDDVPMDEDVPPPLNRVRRMAARGDLVSFCEGRPGCDLLLRAGQPEREELWSLARDAHQAGVSVAIAPARSDAANVGFSYLPLGGMPLLLVKTSAFGPANLVAKSIADRVFAFVGLVVLAAPLLLVATAIAALDGRPVLFRQERVGKDGRPFQVVKFRTMVHDAEDRLVELRDDNQAAGPLFKVKEDPRVTRTGRLLRRYSIDELPQLLNVLKGEMSLVGPRPPLPSEAETYDVRTARRLLVRPGMTGLWQVSGRSDLGWDESVYLDVLYVDHWSPLLDLAIIARTILVVLRSRGAY